MGFLLFVIFIIIICLMFGVISFISDLLVGLIFMVIEKIGDKIKKRKNYDN